MSSDADHNDISRLTLNPAARVLWRSADTVQLELGDRAVVLAGVSQPLVHRLAGYADDQLGEPDQLGEDGSGDDDRPARHPSAFSAGAATGARATRTVLAEVTGTLWSQGFLIRRDGLAPVASPRLATDLGALRARHGEQADTIMARRRQAAVALHGSTRATPTIAALLGAAGIGRVSVAGEGDVRLHQAAPGGLSASDEGSRYAAAVTSAMARAAPDCDTRALTETAADIVVVVGDGPMNVVLRDRLQERDLAHLRVEIYPDRAVVGPLVVPGWFSCLQCADLHRLDRDPSWSLLAVQLESPRRHPEPSDVILTSMAASLAAMQCLAYLDGELPATIEGSLELQPPDWRIRRRSWTPHPDCECGASR